MSCRGERDSKQTSRHLKKQGDGALVRYTSGRVNGGGPAEVASLSRDLRTMREKGMWVSGEEGPGRGKSKGKGCEVGAFLVSISVS